MLLKLSHCADMPILAINYRKPPDHPFPAPQEDCYNAYINLVNKGFSVILAGDSAGGNLSAALCVKRQQEELSLPKAQLLIYPVTDLTLKHPSMDEMAEGFFLTKASMEFFRDQYLKNDELTNVRTNELFKVVEKIDDLKFEASGD